MRILVDHVSNKGWQNRNLDTILPVHLVGVDKDFPWEKLLEQQERLRHGTGGIGCGFKDICSSPYSFLISFIISDFPCITWLKSLEFMH